MPGLPKIFRLRQRFKRERVDDVAAEVRRQLARLDLGRRVRTGDSVAVTAGSRGIVDLPAILGAVVIQLQALGARPFVVPAMGSHGGATAEGQRALLESYGLTEAALGCPIRSSMETVILGHTASGIPVQIDRYAHEADHLLLLNRVKPHTSFVGEIESGLVKMLLIGLGKHAGAEAYHRAIQELSFARIIAETLPLALGRCSVLAGLGIVENGYEETARIQALAPHELEQGEKLLLRLARELLPGLPFRSVDLLVVDEMGKNLSGTGIDTNVVGRRFDDHKAAEGEWPKVRRIAVRGLTSASHGNALGIGIADFCTRRLLEQADMQVTRINALTSLHLSAARLPFVYDTDREMLSVALSTTGVADPERARVLWIRNTLELRELECSAAYREEAEGRPDLTILSDLRAWPLDEQGQLPHI